MAVHRARGLPMVIRQALTGSQLAVGLNPSRPRGAGANQRLSHKVRETAFSFRRRGLSRRQIDHPNDSTGRRRIAPQCRCRWRSSGCSYVLSRIVRPPRAWSSLDPPPLPSGRAAPRGRRTRWPRPSESRWSRPAVLVTVLVRACSARCAADALQARPIIRATRTRRCSRTSGVRALNPRHDRARTLIGPVGAMEHADEPARAVQVQGLRPGGGPRDERRDLASVQVVVDLPSGLAYPQLLDRAGVVRDERLVIAAADRSDAAGDGGRRGESASAYDEPAERD